MFCNNCGKELEAGDVFCGYCGARQEPVPEPIVEEPAAENVTPVVEEPVQPTQESPAGTSSYEERKSPVGWIVAGIAILVIFLVFAFDGTSPSYTPSYTTSTSQTRTEYYNQLLWTGKNKHIPQLAQKVNSTGTYKAEYEGNKLVRISWKQGNESWTWKINDAGTLKELYQEGTENCREIKVHAYKLIYDGAGNQTREENYGVDGRLKEDTYGTAIYEWEYDGAGNQTREENYGVDGRLKENIYGVAIFENEYDGAGNRTRQENYGVDGRLKENTYGVAIIELEYDGAGNKTRQEIYGVDGRLKENINGVAIYEYEYDGAGNRTHLENYGVDGRLKEDIDGVAIYEFEYDGAGNRTRQENYGVDGRLKENIYGIAIYESEYDSSSKEIARRCYNVKGDFVGYVELD